MKWLLFLSQVPSTPSSLRVNVWRKLRAAGALGLQNGVWILPDAPEQVAFLEDLLAAIQDQGASGQIFNISAATPGTEDDLLARFRADREEEYAEFHERSQDVLAEIEKETRKEKFTFAELEEIEEDLQRLSAWLDKIQKRDFLRGESAQNAAKALEACRAAFEGFSNEVYRRQAPETTSREDSEK
jgi:hypothetical protein